MKQKIHKRYIDEAVRIRKSYLKTINKISEKEESILSFKNDIEKIMSETDIIVNDNKNIDDIKLRNILNEKLIDIETNIINIQKEVKPMNDKIERLESDSKKLYDTIKEKYDLEDSEIQNQIINELSKKELL